MFRGFRLRFIDQQLFGLYALVLAALRAIASIPQPFSNWIAIEHYRKSKMQYELILHCSLETTLKGLN